jgi:hypothetical protein
MFKITKDVGKWFKYPDSSDEEYCLKFMPYMEFETHSHLIDEMLVDWKGIQDEKGKDLECDLAAKIAFLKSKEGRKRYAWMMKVASDISKYWELGDLKKNSKRS